MPFERITADWIRQHAGSVLVLHANMGTEHLFHRRVVDRRDGRAIGLAMHDVSYKRAKRNGTKGGTTERTWHVETHEGAIATLEEALEILAIVRAGERLAA